jgi:hypothetical protein
MHPCSSGGFGCALSRSRSVLTHPSSQDTEIRKLAKLADFEVSRQTGCSRCREVVVGVTKPGKQTAHQLLTEVM